MLSHEAELRQVQAKVSLNFLSPSTGSIFQFMVYFGVFFVCFNNCMNSEGIVYCARGAR